MDLRMERLMVLTMYSLIFNGKDARCKCGARQFTIPTHLARQNGKGMISCKCDKCNTWYHTPLSALEDINSISKDLFNVDSNKKLTFTNIFTEKTYICV